MIRKYTFPIVLLMLLMASPAQALHWDLAFRYCPIQIVDIPKLVEELPVPVGCEIVDCCPGCPGPGPIDWRIRIDPETLGGAELRFYGLDRGQLAKLKIEGDARLTDNGSFLLGTGDIAILGLPADRGGKAAVGVIVPRALEDHDANKAGKTDSDEGDFYDGIAIVQYRGRFPVNQFKIRWGWKLCPVWPATDKLKVTNNTGNDDTIAVMDFNSGNGAAGCRNDQLRRLVDTESLGSALANGSCNSEIAVFSDDNAMAFDTPVTTWTDPLGNVHTVALDPIITVPVSIWVADATQVVTAQNDIANANLLYNQNNAGVQFNATIQNVSANAIAVATIGTWCPTAATVGNLQGSAWYTANTLNAYYVNNAFTGLNCGQDRNMNFIGTTANLGSLPHEFGHAYSLRPTASWGHTNGVAGFGNNNIMWGGGPGTRNHFSVGQSFRINTDTTSMLNANGNRAGPTRTCAPNTNSTTCPVLSLDSLPH